MNLWNRPYRTCFYCPETLGIFQLRRELYEEIRRLNGISLPPSSQHLGLQVKSGPVLNDRFLVRDYLIDGSLSLDLTFYDNRIDESLDNFNAYFDGYDKGPVSQNEPPITARSSDYHDDEEPWYEAEPATLAAIPDVARFPVNDGFQQVGEEATHGRFPIHFPEQDTQHRFPGGISTLSTDLSQVFASSDEDSHHEVDELWKGTSTHIPLNHQNWDHSPQNPPEEYYLSRANSWDWSATTELLSDQHMSGEDLLEVPPPLIPAPLDSRSNSAYFIDPAHPYPYLYPPTSQEELEKRISIIQQEFANLGNNDQVRLGITTDPQETLPTITQQFATYKNSTATSTTTSSAWGLPTPSTTSGMNHWHHEPAPLQPLTNDPAISWNQNQQRPTTPKTAIPWPIKFQSDDQNENQGPFGGGATRRPSHPGYWHFGGDEQGQDQDQDRTQTMKGGVDTVSAIWSRGLGGQGGEGDPVWKEGDADGDRMDEREVS